MYAFSRMTHTASVLVCMTFLAACAPTTKAVRNYDFSVDLSELELKDSRAPVLVYTRPNAPTLATYNRFIVDPVIVRYSDPSMKELDQKQVSEMQTYFRDAMTRELKGAGYEVGTRSEPGTLRISLTLSGLKSPGGGTNVAAILLVGPFAISVGEVTVEAQFRDALTNRIDAVVVSKTQGSRFLKAKPWSTWADVHSTFDQWALGFREAVDAAHGR